jgi:predicted amidohydrolase
MTRFAIAAIQMRFEDGGRNAGRMAALLETAVTRFPWVRLVVFSELAVNGADLAAAEPVPGPSEEIFRELAARHGVWLLPGSLFEKAGGQVYNSAVVIDPKGTVVARYRKIFPFRPYEAGVTAGDEACVFDIPDVGRFGVSICYDSWFPEIARTLTAMGAEVLLQPVLTDTIDRDVELSIARATAAQFQTYVVNVNGAGAGGVGRSCIVDPSGHVLHVAGEGEAIIPIELDLAKVRHEREHGVLGLGQTLKSFRDRAIDFKVYDRESGVDAPLHALGRLALPRRPKVNA